MRLFLLLLTVAVVSGCNQSRKIPEDFDYGKTENGVYRNGFFKFEIIIPHNWIVQNKEQMSELRKNGQNTISESNKELGSKIKANSINSAFLLSAFKYSADSAATVDFNPSISIVAENLATISGIKSGGDYLDHAKELMEKSGIGYHFANGYRSETLGGKKFDILDLTINRGGMDIHQSYLTTIINHFALSIINTYSNDKDKDQLDEALKEIRFH